MSGHAPGLPVGVEFVMSRDGMRSWHARYGVVPTVKMAAGLAEWRHVTFLIADLFDLRDQRAPLDRSLDTVAGAAYDATYKLPAWWPAYVEGGQDSTRAAHAAEARSRGWCMRLYWGRDDSAESAESD